MRNILALLLLTALALSCHPGPSLAAQALWSSAGVRGGFSADNKDHHLSQIEAFGVYQLPWEMRADSGWGANTQVQLAAGLLSSAGDHGFIGSVGPALNLGKPGFPLEIDLGVSVAVLTRDTFRDRDYNGYAQFISHGGLNYRFSQGMGIGYRFQHMSNAGMNGHSNPGVDMHMISLNWYLAE